MLLLISDNGPNPVTTNSPLMTSRLPGRRRMIFSPSSRRHVTLGVGLPVARQVSTVSSCSCTAISVDDSSLMISGGTAIKQWPEISFHRTWLLVGAVIFRFRPRWGWYLYPLAIIYRLVSSTRSFNTSNVGGSDNKSIIVNRFVLTEEKCLLHHLTGPNHHHRRYHHGPGILIWLADK